jgi:hypothetical protein
VGFDRGFLSLTGDYGVALLKRGFYGGGGVFGLVCLGDA